LINIEAREGKAKYLPDEEHCGGKRQRGEHGFEPWGVGAVDIRILMSFWPCGGVAEVALREVKRKGGEDDNDHWFK
jgi:hypothetical protein